MKLRLGIAMLAATVLAVLAGCGGTTPAAERQPALPLSERTLENGELPQFALTSSPAPLDLDGFVELAKDSFVRITPEGAVRELTADGFTSAMVAVHLSDKTEAAIASTVVQLGSPEQAKKAMSWAYADSTSPCPNVCNIAIEPFDVPGIPGAKGIKRSRAGNSDGAGPETPFETYEVQFVDGLFLYDLLTIGTKPGEVSQDVMIEAVRTLYARVAGSPPPPEQTSTRRDREQWAALAEVVSAPSPGGVDALGGTRRGRGRPPLHCTSSDSPVSAPILAPVTHGR